MTESNQQADYQEEIWRQTDYYPGYSFSNKGRVYSYKSNQYYVGYKDKDGYIQLDLKSYNNVRKQPLLSRIIYYLFGDEPELLPYRQVDHISRNRTNNNIENLRLATRKENEANKGKRKKNKLGNKPSCNYVGVNWSKSKQKWESFINVGKQFCLGSYKKVENAAYVYNRVASCFKPPNNWYNTLGNNYNLPEEDENREYIIGQKIAKINHYLAN